MTDTDYIPRMGEIVARSLLTADTVALTIKLPGRPFRFTAGQFILLSVAGFGAVPIGIASSPHDEHMIEVAVRRTGTVTERIFEMIVGDEIGVLGPYGNGFPTAKLKGKDVVLVAGGLGLPPLRSLILQIGENPKLVRSLTVMSGARTPADLLYHDEYQDWSKFAKIVPTVDTCSTDWRGCVGRIPELFAHEEVRRGSVMIVCGPPVMYPSVVKHYAGKRIAETDLYFMLERKMHCGVGKCQHCTCGDKYVCLDGPTFSYADLKYNPEALG